SRSSSLSPPATPDDRSPSLHDALPISADAPGEPRQDCAARGRRAGGYRDRGGGGLRAPAVRTGAAAVSARRPRGLTTRRPALGRSEEHTSELQSRENLVCRLLLEKNNR